MIVIKYARLIWVQSQSYEYYTGLGTGSGQISSTVLNFALLPTYVIYFSHTIKFFSLVLKSQTLNSQNFNFFPFKINLIPMTTKS